MGFEQNPRGAYAPEHVSHTTPHPAGDYGHPPPQQHHYTPSPAYTQQQPPQQVPCAGYPPQQQQFSPQETQGAGGLQMWFREAASRSGVLGDRELQTVMRHAGMNFSLELCRQLIAMHDRTARGELTYEDFMLLFRYVEKHRGQFQLLGPDERGVLSHQAVHKAITQTGYTLSRECFLSLMKKFDRWGYNGLPLDGFIELSIFIHNVKDTFAFYDKKRTGNVLFNFDAFTMASAHLFSP
eukprot:Hpha_TRINITY_DN14973_c1_g5::TRINITY_DN14973_c1_g5_i1::g.144668::m.144668